LAPPQEQLAAAQHETAEVLEALHRERLAHARSRSRSRTNSRTNTPRDGSPRGGEDGKRRGGWKRHDAKLEEEEEEEEEETWQSMTDMDGPLEQVDRLEAHVRRQVTATVSPPPQPNTKY